MTLTELPQAERLTAARWVVARLERSAGFTRASSGEGALRIRVGDTSAAGAADASGSVVTATLAPDGYVTVETRTAPPALLVSRDGVRLLPAAPGQCRPTRMEIGDRLLLCSASALDSAPVGLVDILKMPALDVLHMNQAALLHKLLEGTQDGAAAVVMRAEAASS